MNFKKKNGSIKLESESQVIGSQNCEEKKGILRFDIQYIRYDMQ